MSAEVLTLRDEQGGLTLDHFRYEDERSEAIRERHVEAAKKLDEADSVRAKTKVFFAGNVVQGTAAFVKGYAPATAAAP